MHIIPQSTCTQTDVDDDGATRDGTGGRRRRSIAAARTDQLRYIITSIVGSVVLGDLSICERVCQ